MEKKKRDSIFLAVALVVLVLAIWFAFLRGGRTASPTSQPAVAPGGQPATPGQPGKDPSGTQAAAAVPVQPPSHNPFTPLAGTAVGTAAPGGYRSPGPMPTIGPLVLPNSPSAPMMTVSPFPEPIAPGTQMAAAPAVAPEPPPAKLALTGIIYGRPAVAILRRGEERYIVRPGEPVEDYRLAAVGHGEVVLVSSHGKLRLTLGGRL